MPKALHDKLKRQAKKQHLGKEATNAYVYGTLNKIEGKHKKKKNVISRSDRYNVK